MQEQEQGAAPEEAVIESETQETAQPEPDTGETKVETDEERNARLAEEADRLAGSVRPGDPVVPGLAVQSRLPADAAAVDPAELGLFLAHGGRAVRRHPRRGHSASLVGPCDLRLRRDR